MQVIMDRERKQLKNQDHSLLLNKVSRSEEASLIRNKELLAKISQINDEAAKRISETEKLKTIKKDYYDYVQRMYPKWSQKATQCSLTSRSSSEVSPIQPVRPKTLPDSMLQESLYAEFLEKKMKCWKSDSSLRYVDRSTRNSETTDALIQRLELSLQKNEAELRALSETLPARLPADSSRIFMSSSKLVDRHADILTTLTHYQDSTPLNPRNHSSPLQQNHKGDNQAGPNFVYTCDPRARDELEGHILESAPTQRSSRSLQSTGEALPDQVTRNRLDFSAEAASISYDDVRILPQLLGIRSDGQLVLIPMTYPISVPVSNQLNGHVGKTLAQPAEASEKTNLGDFFDVQSNREVPSLNLKSIENLIDNNVQLPPMEGAFAADIRDIEKETKGRVKQISLQDQRVPNRSYPNRNNETERFRDAPNSISSSAVIQSSLGASSVLPYASDETEDHDSNEPFTISHGILPAEIHAKHVSLPSPDSAEIWKLSPDERIPSEVKLSFAGVNGGSQSSPLHRKYSPSHLPTSAQVQSSASLNGRNRIVGNYETVEDPASVIGGPNSDKIFVYQDSPKDLSHQNPFESGSGMLSYSGFCSSSRSVDLIKSSFDGNMEGLSKSTPSVLNCLLDDFEGARAIDTERTQENTEPPFDGESRKHSLSSGTLTDSVKIVDDLEQGILRECETGDIVNSALLEYGSPVDAMSSTANQIVGSVSSRNGVLKAEPVDSNCLMEGQTLVKMIICLSDRIENQECSGLSLDLKLHENLVRDVLSMCESNGDLSRWSLSQLNMVFTKQLQAYMKSTRRVFISDMLTADIEFEGDFRDFVQPEFLDLWDALYSYLSLAIKRFQLTAEALSAVFAPALVPDNPDLTSKLKQCLNKVFSNPVTGLIRAEEFSGHIDQNASQGIDFVPDSSDESVRSDNGQVPLDDKAHLSYSASVLPSTGDSAQRSFNIAIDHPETQKSVSDPLARSLSFDIENVSDDEETSTISFNSDGIPERKSKDPKSRDSTVPRVREDFSFTEEFVESLKSNNLDTSSSAYKKMRELATMTPTFDDDDVLEDLLGASFGISYPKPKYEAYPSVIGVTDSPHNLVSRASLGTTKRLSAQVVQGSLGVSYANESLSLSPSASIASAPSSRPLSPENSPPRATVDASAKLENFASDDDEDRAKTLQDGKLLKKTSSKLIKPGFWENSESESDIDTAVIATASKTPAAARNDEDFDFDFYE